MATGTARILGKTMAARWAEQNRCRYSNPGFSPEANAAFAAAAWDDARRQGKVANDKVFLQDGSVLMRDIQSGAVLAA